MTHASALPSRTDSLNLLHVIRNVPRHLMIGILSGYRAVISPLYGQVCRYFPSCSAYALEAVTIHGAVKGSFLASRRLLRCHPWSSGGVDHVPAHPFRDFSDTSWEKTPRIVMLNHPERYLDRIYDRAV